MGIAIYHYTNDIEIFIIYSLFCHQLLPYLNHSTNLILKQSLGSNLVVIKGIDGMKHPIILMKFIFYFLIGFFFVEESLVVKVVENFVRW